MVERQIVVVVLPVVVARLCLVVLVAVEPRQVDQVAAVVGSNRAVVADRHIVEVDRVDQVVAEQQRQAVVERQYRAGLAVQRHRVVVEH